jgi:hypothetical protein
MGLLMTTSAHSELLKTRLLICLQSLTSSENQDILSELSDLGVVHVLLNMLVLTMKERGHQAASLLGIIMTSLTHMSMHD